MLKVIAALLVIAKTFNQLAEIETVVHRSTCAEEVKETADGDDGRRSVKASLPSEDRKGREDAFERPNPKTIETEEEGLTMFQIVPQREPCVKCIVSKIVWAKGGGFTLCRLIYYKYRVKIQEKHWARPRSTDGKRSRLWCFWQTFSETRRAMGQRGSQFQECQGAGRVGGGAVFVTGDGAEVSGGEAVGGFGSV